ncbi:unnamed protein product [Cyclocybe aegerita]|uniref:U3 small nucleolar RNA-associated protein 11 n=1 Tax=Cyclocybe aegerita TaxID=1973307 RepID=A0A8S0W7K1_CYCAE|nr:unnamed protein product [Cyclocybe aegerita]
MTSSLKNSIHRCNHKERSQLAHRSKLGLLEKHADYVKRARDYHSKQDRLNRLRQKVTERNKDEFYFSMTRQRTKGGVHIQSRGNVALPTDIVKVLKTQDENYVRTMRSSGQKKIDKIKQHLTSTADLLKSESADVADEDIEEELDEKERQILRDAKILQETKASRGKKRKHIIFAESPDEASRLSRKGKEKETVQSVSTPKATLTDEDLGWRSATPKKKRSQAKSASKQESEDNDAEEDNSRQPALSNRKRLLKELSARLDRDRQLRYAIREFEMQRLLMGKGARKKIQGVEKVEGEEDDEEDEDEIDARKGKRKSSSRTVDEATYRPRVYKWRLERRR